MNRQREDEPSRPAPPEDISASSPSAELVVRIAIVGIFLLLFIAFLDLGRVVLLPVVSAIIIGTVLDPLSKRAARFGVPRPIFATAVVGLLLAAVYLGFLVLSYPIVDAVRDAPRTIAIIQGKLRGLQDNFAGIGYLRSLVASDDAKLGFDVTSLIKPVLGFLTPALGELAVFFATLFLFLADQATLRRRVILVFPTHDERLRAIRIFNDIGDSLVRYIGAIAIINLAVGCITGLGLYLLQFPNPIFWGVAVFICNFVPYIGPALMVFAFLIVGLVVFPTIGHALLVPGLFVALTTVEGHFITPNIMGYSFKTGALAAFLSLAFWTWLWGPVGSFLSLPMLIIGSVVFTYVLPTKGVELPE